MIQFIFKWFLFKLNIPKLGFIKIIHLQSHSPGLRAKVTKMSYRRVKSNNNKGQRSFLQVSSMKSLSKTTPAKVLRQGIQIVICKNYCILCMQKIKFPIPALYSTSYIL